MYYKQVVAGEEEEDGPNAQQKRASMRQFGQEIREKHPPEVSNRKRDELRQRIEEEAQVQAAWQQRQEELIAEPKRKGLQYLSEVKQLPKRKGSQENSQLNGSYSTDNHQLSHHQSSSSSQRHSYAQIGGTNEPARPFQGVMR